MRVYISGPMSGVANLNAKAFSEAASALCIAGHTTVNPHDLPNDGSWNHAMRQDIKALCDCDAIYMLPSWRNSVGAQLEMQVAAALGLEVMHAEKA